MATTAPPPPPGPLDGQSRTYSIRGQPSPLSNGSAQGYDFPNTQEQPPMAPSPPQAAPNGNRRPSLLGGHSRASSFFASFRSKPSTESQRSAAASTSTTNLIERQPSRTENGGQADASPQMTQLSPRPTVSSAAPTRTASQSLQSIRTQPPAPPPLHPEIRSVVQLSLAHAHKIYFSGPLVRRIERQPDGQRPTRDEGWKDVWAQLGGTTLSIWDMKEIEEASKAGKEVPPAYVNTTDAFVQLLGSITTPATPTAPSVRYSNVLTLNTAGSNLLLFSCPSTTALMSWAAALRLSAWEKSRLEEIYTAHLIRINNNGAQDIPTTLIRGQMEGWIRIRLAGQTDWKRMWLVVTKGAELEASSPESQPRSVSPSMLRKKRLSNLFSRDREVTEVPPPKSVLSFYTSPKPKDKKVPILTVHDVTQAFAVYPERPELISRSTLLKLEGMIGAEDTAQAMRNREGWLLLMPELEGGSGQSTEMLKWVTGIHDAFELYGRPRLYNWDPREPISMMFGYPVGPHKDLLFLDREFAETMDPREDRTSVVRSQLLNILLARMRGIASGSDAPPPSGGPQLPPLRFDPSTAATRPERHQLTPITERSHTAGTTVDNYPSHRSSTMQSTGTDVLREGSRSSRPVSGPIFDRAVNRSPSPLPPPDETSEQSAPTPRQSEERPISRPDSKFSQVNEQPKTSFDSNTVNPASVGLPVSPPESVRDVGVRGAPMSPVTSTSPSGQPSARKVSSSTPLTPNLPPPAPQQQKDSMAQASSPPKSILSSPVPQQQKDFVAQVPSSTKSVLPSPYSPPQTQKDSGARASSPPRPVLSGPSSLTGQKQKDSSASGLKISESQPSAGPSSSVLSVDGSGGFTDDAGAALYYVEQYDNEKGQTEGSRSRPIPTKATEYDDDDDLSSSEDELQASKPNIQVVTNPNGKPTVANTAGRTPPPSEWQQTASTFASSDLMPTESPISSPLGSRGALVGRKPSGARAPPKVSRQSANNSLSGHQEETDDEVQDNMSVQEQSGAGLQSRTKPPLASESVVDSADALAALSFLDQEQSLPSEKTDEERPKQQLRVESPSTRPGGSGESQQYRSSFAPSKQVAERKARTQAQHEAQTAAAHKPGRANGKKRAKAGSAGAWNDSTDEDEEEEEEDETDDDADSDVEPSALGSKAGHGSSLGHPSSSQPHQAPRDSPAGSTGDHNVYSQLRPVRTLPQVPSRPPGEGDMYSSQSPRHPSDDHRRYPSEDGRRTQYDDPNIRPQSEFPQPGAARQTVWSQVLEPGRTPGPPPELPNNNRDTFIQLEAPEATMTKAFTPQGLLSAGLQDKQDRSAKRQEELARESGASLINVPNKPPPPQTGLLGAITAHERERKREGGVGAALTEREREKRVAEERQRKFDEQQRQQIEQMGQGGSMYGGQFAGYNPMMGNPMMMGAMNPMMTGYMGYPGMMGGYNQQHMFAAQQAAQAYQQAMMAFSVAGSQNGGDGPGAMPMNPTMAGGMVPGTAPAMNPLMAGGMGGPMGNFDPRMSMMSMPMMGPMGSPMGAPMALPMGMQMTGMSQFDPRFGPSSPVDGGLRPPGDFSNQGYGQGQSQGQPTNSGRASPAVGTPRYGSPGNGSPANGSLSHGSGIPADASGPLRPPPPLNPNH